MSARKLLVLVVAGVLLWWLFFHSGISRSLLVAGVTGMIVLLSPLIGKLPVKDTLAWGVSAVLIVLVAIVVGSHFGVPLLAALGIAAFVLFVSVVVLWVARREDTRTEEEVEEEDEFWEERKKSYQLDEDMRSMDRASDDSTRTSALRRP